MAEEMMVHKITLPTGKVVLMKDIELRDEENAAKIAAKKAGDSQSGMGYAMINELMKILIIQIDGKVLSGTDREQISKHLTYKEAVMIRKCMDKLMGEAEAQPTMEFVVSGQQSPG